MSLNEIFEKNIEKFILPPIIGRVKEYLVLVDDEEGAEEKNIDMDKKK